MSKPEKDILKAFILKTEKNVSKKGKLRRLPLMNIGPKILKLLANQTQHDRKITYDSYSGCILQKPPRWKTPRHQPKKKSWG